MTKEHLTTLWKWLCLGCFAYVVGSVTTIQGGIDIFGAKFLADVKKDGLAAVGYFSAIVGSALMNLALVVAIVLAVRHGQAWHQRIPVIMLDGLKTGSVEGRIFQFVVAVVLVVAPIIGIGRSMIVANEGAICEQTSSGTPPIYYPGGDWRLINIPSHVNQLRLMSRDTLPGVCGGQGVEISWYTPVLIGVLPALVVVLFGTWLILLVRKPSRASPSSHAWDDPSPRE